MKTTTFKPKLFKLYNKRDSNKLSTVYGVKGRTLFL